MRSASLIASFRSSIARPTDAPVYASTETSRPPSQNSGSGWIRCSFPVGLFHPLQHAGLSRRTPGRVSKTAPLFNSGGFENTGGWGIRRRHGRICARTGLRVRLGVKASASQGNWRPTRRPHGAVSGAGWTSGAGGGGGGARAQETPSKFATPWFRPLPSPLHVAENTPHKLPHRGHIGLAFPLLVIHEWS